MNCPKSDEEPNFIHSAESSALTQKNSLFNQVFFISLRHSKAFF